jgi:UDP-N-acetylmuramoyl-L-alanyl-D-glutamate--2,6-diaminopimelate ligase
MHLQQIIAALDAATVINPADVPITAIISDSRLVTPGALFVAVTGGATDGHRFVPDAVARGAAAVVCHQADPSWPASIPYIVVEHPRAALAMAAAAFHDMPARHLRVIGVTGTDGKTTTSTLIQAIFVAAGYRVGLITTIGATIDGAFSDIGTHVTTPGAVDIQRFLRQMVDQGIEIAVIETTSHGLDQRRVWGCGYDTAVLTNITREHLDYHGSYEAYRDAKARLFHALREDPVKKPDIPKISVINRGDPAFPIFLSIDADTRIDYGMSSQSSVYADDLTYSLDSTEFMLISPIGQVRVNLALIGEHNVANALAAAAVGIAHGIDLDVIARGLGSVLTVAARMTRVALRAPFAVYVDYAHTPAALEHVLQTARKISTGRVIIVFGLSGGPRDPGKRTMMGEIAGHLADLVVITAVDWYEQDVGEIMQPIIAGCIAAGRVEGRDVWCERDRATGIGRGIALARAGDVVIVAGKGHERSLAIAGREHAWDEFEVVTRAVTTHYTAGEPPV